MVVYFNSVIVGKRIIMQEDALRSILSIDYSRGTKRPLLPFKRLVIDVYTLSLEESAGYI